MYADQILYHKTKTCARCPCTDAHRYKELTLAIWSITMECFMASNMSCKRELKQ